MTPLRRVLELARPRRGRLALGVLAGAGAAGCSVALLATSGFLLSRAALHPPVLELMVAVVAVRAFGLGRGVLRYAERLATHDAALRLMTDLRVRFFELLEPLCPGGLEDDSSGDLLARFVGDVETLKNVLLRAMVPPMVGAAVVVPAVLAAWLLLAGAGLVLAAGAIMAALVLPAVSFVAERRARGREAGLKGMLGTGVVDVLQGSAELTVAGELDARLLAVAATDSELRAVQRRRAVVAAGTSATGTLIAGSALVATLVLGVGAVAGGDLDPVLLAALALLCLASFEVLSPLPLAAQETVATSDAAQRLFSVTDRPAPVTDPEQPRALADDVHSVRLRGAGLRYRPDGPWAVRDVDLELGAGRRIALVGPSGAGKSTVAGLLARFRELDSGTASIGGVDVRDLTQDQVRSVVGLAAQDAHLFDTTIAENVRLARPEASDAEVWAALEAVHLGDWVASLPDGLMTAVGERGRRVSGGQRQRIALARVILGATPVVVLDEPTADLDQSTATAMLADVWHATADRSVLLITHRLKGLEDFDEILVLVGGRVVERGSHADLLTAGGVYRHLWDYEQDRADLLVAV